MSSFSLPEFILSVVTVSNILTVIGLFMTRSEIKRKHILDEEIFTDNIYEQNRVQKLAVLADEEMVQFFAQEQGLSVKQYKIRLANTFKINQVKRMFRRHQRNLVRPEDWVGHIQEAKELFALRSIQKRWKEIEAILADDFREFINQEILPELQPQKTNPNEINCNPNHA